MLHRCTVVCGLSSSLAALPLAEGRLVLGSRRRSSLQVVFALFGPAEILSLDEHLEWRETLYRANRERFAPAAAAFARQMLCRLLTTLEPREEHGLQVLVPMRHVFALEQTVRVDRRYCCDEKAAGVEVRPPSLVAEAQPQSIRPTLDGVERLALLNALFKVAIEPVCTSTRSALRK